jgi:transcriptional regulator with XRE-family HTH domain
MTISIYHESAFTNMRDDIFPERLKAARELRGLSQAALAEKAGAPPTTISHFEAGSRKPSFDSLRRLAQALEVTTDYLLGLAETPIQSVETDPLFKGSQNLTNRDREIALEIVQLLARRSDPQKNSEE